MTFVLVVDDEPAILRTLRINLKARGYEVETAADGRSALQIARERTPDVVVLDLGLPDVDGTAVLAKLRQFCTSPVIVLSARHGSDDKVESLDIGADDYVTKPFSLEEVITRLRVILRRGNVTDDDELARLDPEDLADRRALQRAGGEEGAGVLASACPLELLRCQTTDEGGVVPDDRLAHRHLDGHRSIITGDPVPRLGAGRCRLDTRSSLRSSAGRAWAF